MSKQDLNHHVKIVRISTISFFVETQLKQQILDTKKAGFDVTVITSKNDNLNNYFSSRNIKYFDINIPRNINIISDLVALINLYLVFKRNSYHIVHSTTPKAGLLVSIAAFFTNVPIRLHTFTGQVWANSSGIKRLILKYADKIIIKLNSECFADSFSQVEFLKEQGVIKFDSQVKVLGLGSLAGVDFNRFNLMTLKQNKKALLENFGLNHNNKKIIFVGRITFEKGIVDLVNALRKLLSKGRKYDLILVGDFENGSIPIPPEIIHEINSSKNIFHFDYTKTPENFYLIGDVFCLPSHREGFGTSVIEAAAMGLPAVGTKIVGLVDSISDNKTGILVPCMDSASLANAIEDILENNEKRKIMSDLAFNRAKNNYDGSKVNNYVMDEYRRLVDNATKIKEE
jgi:glycosyltransferase involved in cell wall biosynthesis